MLKTGPIRIPLFTLALLLMSSTCVLAGTTGSISGKVRDQNGDGISGARVTAASPAQAASATTTRAGFYSILNLSPDTYAVTASKEGFETTTVFGVTVTADQATAADIAMQKTIRTLGRVQTTAATSIVNRTVTADLYTVNAQAIQHYNGSVGGAETLYSQNSVVGSLPGVVRSVGTGPGYGFQGSLSLRGGDYGQVGYELDGVPLNRGFDYFNATSFTTNGVAHLQVYTGGAPADEGRAMSGFINEIIARGKYPGGADFTAIVGAPLYNHSVVADIYGGTSDRRFTYFVSTLATNSYVNFGDRSNLANTSFAVPAGDPNCAAFNNGPAVFGSGLPLNCAASYVLAIPAAQGAYFSTPYNAGRDTATNLHWSISHNGLADDLQALYVTGTTAAPTGLYGAPTADPSQASTNFPFGYSGAGLGSNNALTWPTGAFYQGEVGKPYDPRLLLTLTWPTSGNSVNGVIPSTYQDSSSTQYSIEKIAYTRALAQASFLRLIGYKMYSLLNIDGAINGITSGNFYQLHDDMTGLTVTYQNQVDQHHLIKVFGDWDRDLTLRYNYLNYSAVLPANCVVGGVSQVPCTTTAAPVTAISAPSSGWSTVTPLDWDSILSDTWKPSERLLFDLGLRWDQFGFQLMPLKIHGPDGIAYLAEEQDGQCLNGFAYQASDPKILGPLGNQNCAQLLPASGKNAVGAFAWQDASGSLVYTYTSPRFGATFTLDARDVLRLSIGRYVQPPNSGYVEYRRNPLFGPGATAQILNQFYDGLGFNTVHNILPMDSTNYDMSIEHQFGGGYSVKLTPYYRNTRNQVLFLPVNPPSAFVTGDNFGIATINGFEFLATRDTTGATGVGATLAVTETNSKLRFTQPPGGNSYINFLNGTNPSGQCQGVGICGYNQAYNTHYPLLDPNGYFPPSSVLGPNSTWPSYDVQWVINLSVDARTHGFEVVPSFIYQSGNPYGDPLNSPDAHCTAPGPAPKGSGCTPLPTGINPNTGSPYTFYGNFGPDPYTNKFDVLGSLQGPSWWALNLAVSHDVGRNLKASILGTNLLTGVYNHGYPWERPSSQNNVGYDDNLFYATAPLGAFSLATPNPAIAYYGDNYSPYAPFNVLPYRDWVFGLSAKI